MKCEAALYIKCTGLNYFLSQILLCLSPQHISALQVEYCYDINRRDSEILDLDKLDFVVEVQVVRGE